MEPQKAEDKKLLEQQELQVLLSTMYSRFNIPNDRSLQIAIGNEDGRRIVYSNIPQLERNTLTKLQKKFIEFATSQPEQVSHDKPSSYLEADVSIVAGEREVYRMQKGLVEINQSYDKADRAQTLGQSGTQQPANTNDKQTPGLQPFINITSAATQPAQINYEPQQTDWPKHHNVTPKPNIPAPPQAVHDFTPVVQTTVDQLDQLTPAVSQPWMTTEPRHKVAQAMTSAMPKLQRVQVMTTARALLQKYGTVQGNQTRLKTEHYQIIAKGALIEIADQYGQQLALFQKTSLGRARPLYHEMTTQQQADFLNAGQFINQHGIQNIAQNPIVRRQQLGGLSPMADRGFAQDVVGMGVAQIARHYLDASGLQANSKGKRVFKGHLYTITDISTPTTNALFITTKSGNTVLSLQNGHLKTNLSPADIKAFSEVQSLLKKPAKQRAPSKGIAR